MLWSILGNRCPACREGRLFWGRLRPIRKSLKIERVLAFEDPFVSPNRLFPCGSGCNQNQFPIPEWVCRGYEMRKKNRGKQYK